MPEQITGSLGIELGADEAIADARTLKLEFKEMAKSADAVVAASQANTKSFKEQAKASRELATQARAQESAQREAANAQKVGANASAKAAADEARQLKEAQKALADKARAEETSAKEATRAAAAEKRATDALEQRTRSMALQELEAHKLNAAFDKNVQAGNGVVGMYNKLGAAAAAYKVLQYVREGIELADTYTNIESKLGLVTNGMAGLTKTTNALFDISQDTRTELGANVSLYTSMYRATRTLGTSQEDLLTVNKAVAQSFLINGAATSESAAATRQLGQALASGVLRGDEFNSIAENAPRIQQAVAESLGVTTGELREMAAQGKLTGAVVVKAMVDAAQAIDSEASKIAPTYASASKRAGNAILLLVGRINEAAGFTRSLASEVQSFADIAGKLAKDQELVNYWTEVGRGFRTGNAVFEDTKEGLVSLATVGLRSVQFGTALATKDFAGLEARADTLKKAIDALNNSYGDTGKVLAKPVQKSVLGYSDFGSNPKPLAKPAAAAATKEEIEAQKKLQEQYDKTYASAKRDLDQQVGLREVYSKGARAIEDFNDEMELKNKLASIDEKLSNTQKARLTEVYIGIYSNKKAVTELRRAEEDRQANFLALFAPELAARDAMLKKQGEQTIKINETAAAFERYGKVAVGVAKASRDAVDKTSKGLAKPSTLADDMRSTLKITEAIGDTLTNSGKEFASTISRAVSGIASAVDSVGKIKSTSSGSEKISAGGDVIGAAVLYFKGVYSLASTAFEKLVFHNKEAQAEKEFRAAVKEFGNSVADWTRSTLDQYTNGQQQARQNLAYQVGSKVSEAALLAGYDTAPKSQQITSDQLDQFQARVDGLKLDAARRGDDKEFDRLTKFSELLKDIAGSAAVAETALKAQQKAEQDKFSASNDVLAARIKGDNALADSLQSIADIDEKYRSAVDKFGETTETARYKTLLLADAEKKLADQREAEAKRLDRSVYDIKTDTKAIFDPRGASEDAFFESWKRRIDDAATAEEKLALQGNAAAAAMDFFAKQLAADTKETRGYLSRIFSANGDSRSAEDAARLSSQLEERQNNIGSTPANRLLSDRAQYLENSAILRDRNIEDGTKRLTDAANAKLKDIDTLLAGEKAIADKRIADLASYAADEKELNAAFNRAKDDEIKVIEDSAKVRLDNLAREAEYARAAEQASQKQLTLIQQEVDARRGAVESLKAYTDSLKLSDLSTLSPVDKAAEAKKQFDVVSAKALGGDASSVSATIAAANELLQQKRNTDASGVGYAAEFDRVQSIIGALKNQFGEGLVKSESALNKAQTAADAAALNIAAIEAERQAIQDATTKQVDAINLLREEGNTASAKLLESWQKESDKVGLKYTAFAEEQSKAKDLISEKLAESINTLKDNEQAAYDERAKLATWRDELYKQQEEATNYLEKIANGISGAGVLNGSSGILNLPFVPIVNATSQPAPVSQGESQLIAQVQLLTTAVADLKKELATISTNTQATANATTAGARRVSDSVETNFGKLTSEVTRTRQMIEES